MRSSYIMARPVRGTQKLVDQMGWVIQRPSLTALELAWRWTVGIPLLAICWIEGRRILAVLPPESTGLTTIDAQNPWVAAIQLADVWARYEPSITAVLRWVVPVAATAWVIASGIGRGLLVARLEPGVRARPLSTIALQAVWLALFALIFCAWLASMQWAAVTHITAGGEADLVGYFAWAIFLSLGFFTLWALVSWPFSIAPMLLLLERRSPVSALAASLRLGREFTGKLMETNLVMGIVKLALVVLAMVFSAAPLPFSDELGSSATHLVWAGATFFYLAASDYFHVVRLKGFLEFWRTYRGGYTVPGQP